MFQILHEYAGDNIDGARIIIFSDGRGIVRNAISLIIHDGIILDTVLYE